MASCADGELFVNKFFAINFSQERKLPMQRNMDYANSEFAGAAGIILVTLDGETVKVPAGRCSLNAIRSLLETLALEKQCIVSSLSVDGQPVGLAPAKTGSVNFSRVEADSVPLAELPLLLLTTAQQQVERVREAIENALTLVLINNRSTARELWWNIARQLKDPILTLSLMPEPVGQPSGSVSFERLRKWQLQQIAAIIREVDAVCENGDNIKLSDVLERRVLPWAQKLNDLIQLWHQTVSAGYQLGINSHAA
jgi:hypothetical protein